MSSTSASRGRMPRHLLALASSITLIAGVGIALAPAAFADDPPAPDTSASHASARFLSGTWDTAGADAEYLGGSSTGTVSKTNAVASWLDGSPTPNFDIALGSEFAEAAAGGSSWAASGRVTGAGNTAGAATVNLDAVLASAGLSDLLSEFHLELQQISSVAKLDAATFDSAAGLAATCASATATNCRDYTLEAGNLHMQSPAVVKLYNEAVRIATALDSAIGALSLDISPDATTGALINGGVATAVSIAANANGYLLSTANVDGTVSASVTVTSQVLQKIVELLGQVSLGGVDLDFTTGDIDVNLTQVVGPLNGLDPNTPIFDAAVFDKIAAAVDALIDSAVAGVTDAVTSVINAVKVNVSVATSGTLNVPWVQWCTIGPVSYPCHQGTDHGGFTVEANYSGGLLDVLTGNGTSAVTFATPDASPARVKSLVTTLNGAGFASGVKGMIEALTGNGFLDEDTINDAISSFVTDAADGLKQFSDQGLADLGSHLRSLSNYFGGTVNVQDPGTDGTYSVSALELRFGSAAPLRSGSAFKAAPRPAAIALPPVTVRLATSIVGQNRSSTPCLAGKHYDPKTGTCVNDSTPPTVPAGGGGTPTTTTTPPTTTTTAPSTEVLGSSDTTTSPSVTVKGESSEAPQTTQVLGLAETGPHDVALIAVLGLELLLGGIAIIRLTARRRRELTDQHHV